MDATKSRTPTLKIIVFTSLGLFLWLSVEGVLYFRQSSAMKVVFEQRHRIEALGYDVSEPPDERYAETSAVAGHPIIAAACDAVRKQSTILRPLSTRLVDSGCFAKDDVAAAMEAVHAPLLAATDHILAGGDRQDDDILPAKSLESIFLAQALALLGAQNIRAGREAEAERSFEAAFELAHVSARRPSYLAQMAAMSAWNQVEQVLRSELGRFGNPVAVAAKARFDADASRIREATLNETRLLLWSLSQISTKSGIRVGSLVRGNLEADISQRKTAGDYLRQQADFIEAEKKLSDPADLLRLAKTRTTEFAFNSLVLFEDQRLRCRRLGIGAQIIDYRRKNGGFPVALEEVGIDAGPVSPTRGSIRFSSVPDGVDLAISGVDVWTIR